LRGLLHFNYNYHKLFPEVKASGNAVSIDSLVSCCKINEIPSEFYCEYKLTFVYMFLRGKYEIKDRSLARGPKLLEKQIQVCLGVKGDHFQHRL
jgi:hypothetical protein